MELIERINEYLNKQFCVEYTGKMQLKVEAEDDSDFFFYTLEWPLNPDDQRNPLTLAGQFLNDDDFFEYIKKQIKNKRFFLYKNFRVIKVPANDKP